MRLGCVIAFFGCVASLATAAEQEFPYTAYVVAPETMIRGGPGRNVYATEQLDRGAKIEVYRHEGDWCGIRPPQESFSWVRAEDLRIGHDRVGIVTNEGAPCWVGSHVNDFRDVIQVRLERGEEVDVLDAVQLGDHGGTEFYCKIAPPSGEFRWIHKDDISREKPDSDTDNVRGGRRRRPFVSARAERDEDRGPARRESDHWGSWVRSRGSELASASDSTTAGSRSWRSGSAGDRSVALASADGDAKSDVRNSTPSDQTVDSVADRSQEADVDAIERELSRIVVDDPARWNFEALRKRIEASLGTATTALERGKIRLVQNKIAKFEEIHRRSLMLSLPVAEGRAALALSGRGGDNESPPSKPPAPVDSIEPVDTGDVGRYDGVGKLTRVVSQRPNAPRYALVNNSDEVVSFVSPAPGVNLQSFEGQYVGISGQRGYMPELKKPHVTALRVSPMEVGQAGDIRRRR